MTQVRQGDRKSNPVWRHSSHLWKQTHYTTAVFLSLYGSNAYWLYYSRSPSADMVNVNREILNHTLSEKRQSERERKINLSLTCWLKMISMPTYLLKSCHLRWRNWELEGKGSEAGCCLRHCGRGDWWEVSKDRQKQNTKEQKKDTLKRLSD